LDSYASDYVAFLCLSGVAVRGFLLSSLLLAVFFIRFAVFQQQRYIRISMSSGVAVRRACEYRGHVTTESAQSASPQFQEKGEQLIAGPRWVTDVKTDWPLTIGRNMTLT
jgi:hypothetical protein